MPATPLADLLFRLTRLRAGARWADDVSPEDALRLLDAAEDRDLQELRRLWPRSWDVLLIRFGRQLDLPRERVDRALSRAWALPPPASRDPFDTPECVDWAVERARNLFGRLR